MVDFTAIALDELSDIEFDSYIAGNIAILELLRQLNLPITLSTTLGIYSSSSVDFFVNLYHTKRVILPRDMMFDEIKSIVTNYPNQEFEVFLYGDSCRWSDGHCFVEHGYDSIDKGLPFCMHLKENAKPLQRLDPLFKAKLKNKTFSHDTISYKQHLIQDDFTQKESFSKLSSDGIKEALCFFEKFPNIKGYKIPSRGRDVPKLLSYIHNNSHKTYKTALYQ